MLGSASKPILWHLFVLLSVLAVVQNIDILQDSLNQRDVNLVNQVETSLFDLLNGAPLRPSVPLEWVAGDLLR